MTDGQSGKPDDKDQMLDSLTATTWWGDLMREVGEMGCKGLVQGMVPIRNRTSYDLVYRTIPTPRIVVSLKKGNTAMYEAAIIMLGASGSYEFNLNGHGLEVIFKPVANSSA